MFYLLNNILLMIYYLLVKKLILTIKHLTNLKILFVILFLSVLAVSCINPFATKYEESLQEKSVLADQKNISGVFDNFRYAYIFKDTIVYGKLLSPDFVFVYRNYEQGIDVSWGREEDMMTTYGLFQAAQSLDLIWNEVIISQGETNLQDISRGFSLTIVFSTSDIVRLQGRVNLRIRRNSEADIWQIIRWRDESNY